MTDAAAIWAAGFWGCFAGILVANLATVGATILVSEVKRQRQAAAMNAMLDAEVAKQPKGPWGGPQVRRR